MPVFKYAKSRSHELENLRPLGRCHEVVRRHFSKMKKGNGNHPIILSEIDIWNSGVTMCKESLISRG